MDAALFLSVIALIISVISLTVNIVRYFDAIAKADYRSVLPFMAGVALSLFGLVVLAFILLESARIGVNAMVGDAIQAMLQPGEQPDSVDILGALATVYLSGPLFLTGGLILMWYSIRRYRRPGAVTITKYS